MRKSIKTMVSVVGALLVVLLVVGIVGIVKKRQTTTVSPVSQCEHDIVVDKGYAATCAKSGLTDGSHCSECGEVLTPQTLIAATGHIYSNGICLACEAPDPSVTVDVNSFYLVGSMNNWTWTSNKYKFTPVVTDLSYVTSQYKLTIYLSENTECKIWKGNDDWAYNNFEDDWDYATRGDNLTITQSGTYTFYLKFYAEGNNSVYVEKN